MKSEEQIQKARDVVCEAMRRKDLSDEQQALLSGLSVALCWVSDDGGITLQMMVDGVPIVPQTPKE